VTAMPFGARWRAARLPRIGDSVAHMAVEHPASMLLQPSALSRTQYPCHSPSICGHLDASHAAFARPSQTGDVVKAGTAREFTPKERVITLQAAQVQLAYCADRLDSRSSTSACI
jgi:hypothetical protein